MKEIKVIELIAGSSTAPEENKEVLCSVTICEVNQNAVNNSNTICSPSFKESLAVHQFKLNSTTHPK